MQYIIQWILITLKKEENLAMCNNMDEPWRHARWNKSVTVGQILHHSTYLK